MACTWFGEICSCCCLTVLLGPAWVLLSKIYKPFAGSLYRLSWAMDDDIGTRKRRPKILIISLVSPCSQGQFVLTFIRLYIPPNPALHARNVPFGDLRTL